MKTIRVVAAIIKSVDENGRPVIFATQRGYGKYKDWWEFPGGKIESGETPEQALIREIHEELNAGITVDEYLTTVEYDYPDFHLSMDCFWCSLVQGHLTLLEHEAARWLTVQNLRQVNWLPADIQVIEAIEAADAGEENATDQDTSETGSQSAVSGSIDYLVLVNKQNPLPDGWEEALDISEAVNSRGEQVKSEAKAYEAFMSLRDDLEKNDGIYIELDSAYRSVKEQQELVDDFTRRYGAAYVAKTVAVPGYSEHHTGLALDLYFRLKGEDGQFTDVYKNEDMVQHPEIWERIHEKLADHGFILRYLEGKEHITGYDYEPWHIRFLNDRSIARDIMDKGITYEEYLGLVRSAEVSLDYGTSELYTQDELIKVFNLVKCQFASWEGCELLSIRYAGDECCTEENIKWMNDLSDANTYDKCIELIMDFNSPVEQAGAWEPDTEYKDFQWWIAGTEKGDWDIMTWGY